MENIRLFMRTLTQNPWLAVGLRLGFILIAIWGFMTLLNRLYRRYLAKRVSRQVDMLITKAIWYTALTIMLLYVLSEFGISLSAVLGAAGIAGVGIGFAARTSLSNIISGLFILGEGELKIGDIITNGNFTGQLVSIDLLSVNLQTLDNKLVRIPNEYFVINISKNLTYYKKRRVDILVHVPIEHDAMKIKKILEIALAHASGVLPNPKFSVSLYGISTTAQEFSINAWVKTHEFTDAFEPIALQVQESLGKENITASIMQQNKW